jgi:feruloyl esterase
MRIRFFLVGAACGALLGCGEASRSPQDSAAVAAAPVACEALRTVAVPNTTLSVVERVAAGQFQSPVPDLPFQPPTNYSALPSFCRVAGVLTPSADSQIGFELWLPETGWNGKFLQVGNGGAAGAIVYPPLAETLLRGYAVANTDTGHQAAGGDFSWASGHPEKVTDYAYRAVHELTLAARALTTAHYGQAPNRSYWNGCSTGGRQGLMEAQRFPDDYDAIIAGAPANNWVPLMSFSIEVSRNMTGPNGLGVDKLGLLKEAAIAQCDALDGVADRVIGAPAQCRFDPASLACGTAAAGMCLSPTEVAAAQRIYAGVVDRSGTTLFPGTGPASEPLWAAYASPQFKIGVDYFRHVVAQDPSWDPAEFDVDRDVARAEEVDGGATRATDPDLSAFIARGGKLLLYHGTTDGLIPYANTENYYRSVVAELGTQTIANQLRFFPVPGMDHCAGGEGAFAIDWLGALERWDADNVAPDSLPASRPPGTTPMTRLVCAYPQSARYTGSGSPADAANWTCAAP